MQLHFIWAILNVILFTIVKRNIVKCLWLVILSFGHIYRFCENTFSGMCFEPTHSIIGWQWQLWQSWGWGGIVALLSASNAGELGSNVSRTWLLKVTPMREKEIPTVFKSHIAAISLTDWHIMIKNENNKTMAQCNCHI